MAPFLQVERISKSYLSGSKRLQVLRQFDMELARGELLAIVGRSGSGKTTLLNLLAGLDRPDEGRIVLDGRELTALDRADWDHIRRRDIGFVFQFNQLLPEFTALENVMLPAMLVPYRRKVVEEKACDLLSRMGMSERLGHRPSQLSGGEQQRTAIARALINSPRLLLADEPTGNLDVESGQTVFDLLLSLQKELQISCVMVTHNPALANLCDRIHGLDRRIPPGSEDHSSLGA